MLSLHHIFFGCFFGRPSVASSRDAAWRRCSVQPASRQTTCCRLGNKTFGCYLQATAYIVMVCGDGRYIYKPRPI